MASRILWGCGRTAVADPTRPPPGNFTVNAEAAEDEKAEPGTVPTVPTGPPNRTTANRTTAEDRIYDLEYFQNFGDLNCPWKNHNVALKWFRDRLERFDETRVDFPNTQPVRLPAIIHDKGPDYHFDAEGPGWDWSWQSMVAQMHNDSMRKVVQGLDNRSRGLTSCRLQKTDQYDHKRHHNLPRGTPGGEEMFKVWDFVLTRDDGSCVSLRPNYSNTKIACKYGEREADHEVPRTGPGGSSGPGTYKLFTSRQTDEVLRFDAHTRARTKTLQSRSNTASASSGPPPPQSRSNPASASSGLPPPAPMRPPPLPPPPAPEEETQVAETDWLDCSADRCIDHLYDDDY